MRKKPELSNNQFASQRSLVKNASTLPPNLENKTDERLYYFFINDNDIFSMIKNASKTHGRDKKLIRMIELCGKIIVSMILYFDHC